MCVCIYKFTKFHTIFSEITTFEPWSNAWSNHLSNFAFDVFVPERTPNFDSPHRWYTAIWTGTSSTFLRNRSVVRSSVGCFYDDISRVRWRTLASRRCSLRRSTISNDYPNVYHVRRPYDRFWFPPSITKKLIKNCYPWRIYFDRCAILKKMWSKALPKQRDS